MTNKQNEPSTALLKLQFTLRLNSSELADYLGISKSMLSLIKDKHRRCSPVIARKIIAKAAEAGVEIEYTKLVSTKYGGEE